MAEFEQDFVENNEQQNYSLQESDQHPLGIDEFDQQNIDGTVPVEYTFAGDESINHSLAENEQGFTGNETENNFGVVSEQNHLENESEHTLGEDQANQGQDGNELKQEFEQDEANETGNVPGDSHIDNNGEHENKLASGGGEKKWPGWPGESVFRILVPVQKVGNIIGRKGEYIKKMVEETKARIKVLDGPPGSQQRAVMVSAKEEPDASLPPAMSGLLRVHRRIVDGLDEDSSEAAPAGGKVSTRLLVPATQAGSLIGKQGATVKSIQETSNCTVRVLGQDELPAFALQDDRVVEIVGEPANVHGAVEIIASHLRKFLVDRSIIPVFEKLMQAPSNPMEHMAPQPWGPPHPHGLPPNAGGAYGYGPGPGYMPPPPRQFDNYYPPADMPPPADRQPHQGISAYGREPPMGVHASSNAQPAQSMITQVTQQMQIPLLYADSVIGTNGATISYIRRASGATVTIQETRGVPTEMTVEINGTASQAQAAQQLIQNFMAEAAAAQGQSQAGGATEQGYGQQGYSSYATAAPPSVYGSPPSSAGHAAQPGAYGSVYGANYGY